MFITLIGLYLVNCFDDNNCQDSITTGQTILKWTIILLPILRLSIIFYYLCWQMITFYHNFLQWQSNNQRMEMLPISITGQEKNNLANGPTILNSYVRVSGLRNINKYAIPANIRQISRETVASNETNSNPASNKKDN